MQEGEVPLGIPFDVRFASLGGGLIGADKLVRSCPEPFTLYRNKWAAYAKWLKIQEDEVIEELSEDWDWKSDDTDLRERQIRCLKALFHTGKGINHEDMACVGGWMLHNMLEEVPPIKHSVHSAVV